MTAAPTNLDILKPERRLRRAVMMLDLDLAVFRDHLDELDLTEVPESTTDLADAVEEFLDAWRSK